MTARASLAALGQHHRVPGHAVAFRRANHPDAGPRLAAMPTEDREAAFAEQRATGWRIDD